MSVSRPLAAVLILSSLIACTAEAQGPNVIFIMTDDLGYGDLEVYGGDDIATPNLNQIAAQGVRFTDFYANGANCSPTRAGFLTGRYQHRYGVEWPITHREAAEGEGVSADGRTLPQLVKDAGYNTAMVGKWHLGHEDNQSPNAHGFDYFYGFRSGLIDFYQHTDTAGNPDFWENEEEISVEGYATDLITAKAVEYIDGNAGDAPFFLSVQYNAPHWPYQPPDSPSIAEDNAAHLQPDDANPGSRDDYIAMVERVDQGIGEIMTALDRAGVADNTMIIFTNDNGGEWLSDNDPLFHRKSSVYEGGIRVPALVSWPDVIPGGQVTNQVGITMDMTATILAATGADIPGDLELDGMNLLPVMTGDQPVTERTLFWRSRGEARAVRKGDWKLIVEFSGFGEVSQIYNLQRDIGEHDNISRTDQGRAVARELRPLLDAWEEEMTAISSTYPWGYEVEEAAAD